MRICALLREGKQAVWERMLIKSHPHCFTAQSGKTERERGGEREARLRIELEPLELHPIGHNHSQTVSHDDILWGREWVRGSSWVYTVQYKAQFLPCETNFRIHLGQGIFWTGVQSPSGGRFFFFFFSPHNIIYYFILLVRNYINF